MAERSPCTLRSRRASLAVGVARAIEIILAYLAEGNDFTKSGIGKHNVQMTKFVFDSFKQLIKINHFRYVALHTECRAANRPNRFI